MDGKESLKRIYEQLSEEQKEKFRNCNNMDEVMKLANEENFEISEDQLDFLAGGDACCPHHGCNPLCRDADCPHLCHRYPG